MSHIAEWKVGAVVGGTGSPILLIVMEFMGAVSPVHATSFFSPFAYQFLILSAIIGVAYGALVGRLMEEL